MRRYKIIPKEEIESVLKACVLSKPLGRVGIRHYPIVTDTDRYENLYHNGCKCAKCGLEAEFAAIEKEEKSKDKFHINVYVVDNRGKELMLTKDHIYPRALGGYDDLCNYQVLCERCNTKKGDGTDLTPEEAIEKGYTSKEVVELVSKLRAEQEIQRHMEQELKCQRARVAALTKKVKEAIPERDKKEFM